MTVALAGLIFAMGVVLIYVFGIKPLIRNHPRFKPFYDWLEPIEVSLWNKSRTLLLARLYSLAGFLITAQAVLDSSGVDWLSLFPIPEGYARYVGPAVWVTGLLFARMRKMTTSSLDERKEQF